jgi:hypothetical protein
MQIENSRLKDRLFPSAEEQGTSHEIEKGKTEVTSVRPDIPMPPLDRERRAAVRWLPLECHTWQFSNTFYEFPCPYPRPLNGAFDLLIREAASDIKYACS